MPWDSAPSCAHSGSQSKEENNAWNNAGTKAASHITMPNLKEGGVQWHLVFGRRSRNIQRTALMATTNVHLTTPGRCLPPLQTAHGYKASRSRT